LQDVVELERFEPLFLSRVRQQQSGDPAAQATSGNIKEPAEISALYGLQVTFGRIADLSLDHFFIAFAS
jgi:hypothetical protein